MHLPKRTVRRACICGLVLFWIAAFIVDSTTDRPLTWGEWVGFSAMVTVFLCMFVGLVSMLAGLAVWLLLHDFDLSQELTAFGVTLAFLFLFVLFIPSAFRRRKRDSKEA